MVDIPRNWGVLIRQPQGRRTPGDRRKEAGGRVKQEEIAAGVSVVEIIDPGAW